MGGGGGGTSSSSSADTHEYAIGSRKRPRIDAADYEINPTTMTMTSSHFPPKYGTLASTSSSLEEEEEEKKWQLTLSDTSVALRMMCAQFPLTDKLLLRPFVLRSQLYSCLKDRTQVDRDLQSLKIQKVIRIFKLNTGQDDHAVMFMDDYFTQIETTTNRLSLGNTDKMEVFKWFRTYVIDSKLDVSIEHQELCSLLSFGGKVIDDHVSLLINSGLLTRQLIDSNMYWFAIPNIGSVLKGLSQGRKELLSLLERRKFKEMPLASLEKKRLRLSSLDMRFHLRDLIGSGHLKTHRTPVGIVVRISKD